VNTSLEYCGNLVFVLAFLPWDLGCALFVAFISRLCMIKSMPPSLHKLFRNILNWITLMFKVNELLTHGVATASVIFNPSFIFNV
jgi:hypothetical protein